VVICCCLQKRNKGTYMEPCSWPPAHNWFCSSILCASPQGVVCYGAKNHLVIVEPGAPPKCTVLPQAFDDRTRVRIFSNVRRCTFSLAATLYLFVPVLIDIDLNFLSFFHSFIGSSLFSNRPSFISSLDSGRSSFGAKLFSCNASHRYDAVLSLIKSFPRNVLLILD
jgi:hypothetical protein